MSGVATAIAGSAVVGAVASSKAAKKAASVSKQSTDAAVGEQRRQFDVTQQNQAPWLDAGRNALTQLSDPTKNFMASPDYAFRQSEGIKGIERTAAARGGAYSGNALKALNEYNSNLASGEFGNWWNRQAGLAGVGQASANTLAQTGQSTANNVGNALMAGGDARASGVLGATNGVVGNINQGVNNYLTYKNGGYGGGQPSNAGWYKGNSYADLYG